MYMPLNWAEQGDDAMKMPELVRRAKRRDAGAFVELIECCMQSLYKTAYAITENDADAADAISETILKCWEKLPDLKKEKYFKTWITRILINNCYDLMRRGTWEFPAESIPELPHADSGYENAEWKNVIDSIDEKYRLILILRYVENFNSTEIAEMLDLPAATVRTRISRGLKQLKQKIAPSIERSLVW